MAPSSTELTLDSGRLRVLVHHYVGYPPLQWLLTCYPPLFDKTSLGDKVNLDEAQDKAVELVAARLHRWSAEVKNAIKNQKRSK